MINNDVGSYAKTCNVINTFCGDTLDGMVYKGVLVKTATWHIGPSRDNVALSQSHTQNYYVWLSA